MEKKKDLNDGLMQAKGGRCGERSMEGGGWKESRNADSNPTQAREYIVFELFHTLAPIWRRLSHQMLG